MRNLSIRWRLTIWYAVVLAAALGLFSGLTWFSLRQKLANDVEQGLNASSARFQNYFAREAAELPAGKSPDQLKDELEEFCQALPASEYVELRGSNGFMFQYPVAGRHEGRHVRSMVREFAVAGDTYNLSTSASLIPMERTLELLGWLLVSLVPVAIAIACAGGAWLARRAMKPVDEITLAARTIGIDNLSMRLPVPNTGDELQRLTEVWNGMLARLEAAVKTLSQFAADASHELRTPLAVIRTTAELALRRARSPESYQGSMREIGEETQRMTRLVEDLLFLARNEARGAEMPMEPLDLQALVGEVTAEVAELAGAQGITIRCEAKHTALVSGNRPALRRLLLVLLDNAIKYSTAGSEVLAGLELGPGKAIVTVRDFGPGIRSSDLPHIFKRFYQADEARSDGGFGLGLSLAESIVRVHGGSIEVESEEAMGSIFRVVLRVERDGMRASFAPAAVTVPYADASLHSESAK
jgi:signal transduction histidine kinase